MKVTPATLLFLYSIPITWSGGWHLTGQGQAQAATPATEYPTKSVRLIVLTSGKARSSAAPDLPTFTELGLPGVAVDVWYGMLAPARPPPAIFSMPGSRILGALD